MASQPTTRGRSTRHDRRCFGRLEQEDQRLKKQYGRWMDIVRSLELESFILTKLTKPSVLVNLVGPQVSHQICWGAAIIGRNGFFRITRRHFLPCEDIAGGSQLSGGGTNFSRNKDTLPCVQRYSLWVRPDSWGGHFFREIQKPFPRTMRNKEELSLRATMDLVGPNRQALHVQSSFDDSCLLTMPRRGHQGGGRRRGLGRG